MSRYSTDIIDEYWSDNQTLLHWKIIEEQLLIAQFNCGVAGIEERSAALVGNARVRVSDWQKETANAGTSITLSCAACQPMALSRCTSVLRPPTSPTQR